VIYKSTISSQQLQHGYVRVKPLCYNQIILLLKEDIAMTKSYGETYKSAKYKLTGSGPRVVG
jgi:hypothetical protein